ncbi:hypothetical protein J6590_089114 [Homalodisca vitripennis]|nr:hypothetical protein J6590_089114 [Homalodisca vitripennis]
MKGFLRENDKCYSLFNSELSFSDPDSYATQRAPGRLRGMCRHSMGVPKAEWSKTLDFEAELEIAQVRILSVTVAISISTVELVLYRLFPLFCLISMISILFGFSFKKYRGAAGLLSMETICRLQTCDLIHLVLSLQEPRYLVERLLYRGEVADRRTRQDNRLHILRVRPQIGRRSYFSYFAPKSYNFLPCDLKSLKETAS